MAATAVAGSKADGLAAIIIFYNWLSGKNAPSGVHLVMLARESNAVLKALMLMAERPEMSLGASLLSLKRLLAETMAALDQMM